MSQKSDITPCGKIRSQRNLMSSLHLPKVCLGSTTDYKLPADITSAPGGRAKNRGRRGHSCPNVRFWPDAKNMNTERRPPHPSPAARGHMVAAVVEGGGLLPVARATPGQVLAADGELWRGGAGIPGRERPVFSSTPPWEPALAARGPPGPEAGISRLAGARVPGPSTLGHSR